MLELLCAILREGPFEWNDVAASRAVPLYELARVHGVHLLVAERVWQRGENDCPQALRERLAVSLRNQVAVEEIARQELQAVIAAMNDAGVSPLLFKGSALAYTHYSAPALRPRFDTDFLVDIEETPLAFATLERLGYRRPPFTSGDLVMYQVPYSRTDRRGVRHTIDVHWRISNPQIFASALTLEELRRHPTPVRALGSGAQAVAAPHALALACIHRVAHHALDERLIWLYDIHLLAERLTPTEQEQFINLARAKELTAVCAGGLEAAERKFLGRGTASLLARLAPDATLQNERFDIYVTGKMRKIDVLVSDLKALTWRRRLKLLREHVLPPPSYMREAYGISHTALLPFAYAWRVVRGARDWWRPIGRRDRK